MDSTQWTSLISSGVALLAVFVSFYAIREARRTALTGTYFSEMAAAYAGYLRCVSGYFFLHGLEGRDELTGALYRLMLFASPDICVCAQELYTDLCTLKDYSHESRSRLDKRLDFLENMMRSDLESYRKRGRRKSDHTLSQVAARLFCR